MKFLAVKLIAMTTKSTTQVLGARTKKKPIVVDHSRCKRHESMLEKYVNRQFSTEVAHRRYKRVGLYCSRSPGKFVMPSEAQRKIDRIKRAGIDGNSGGKERLSQCLF